MQSHKRRTGVGERALLRDASDKPDGLSYDVILRWLNGKATTAREDHLDYVLKRWENADRWLPLTQEIVATLRTHRDRTGVGPAVLLRDQKPLLARLMPATVESWLSGAANSARVSHLETVLELWEVLPDNPYVTLTELMIQELNELIAATGVTPTRLLRMAENPPPDVKAGDVSRWKTGRVSKVRQRYFEYVINRYKHLSRMDSI